MRRMMSIEQTAGAASMRARLPPGGQNETKHSTESPGNLRLRPFPHPFRLVVEKQKDPRTFVQPSLSFIFLFHRALGKFCEISLSLVQGRELLMCVARGATRDRWWLFYPPAGCSTLDPLPSVLVLRVQKKGERALPRPRTRREA